MENDKPKKKFYKRWWFWTLVVVVLIIVIGASSGNNTPTKIGENGSAEGAQAAASNSQSQTFKVGDQIKQGDTVLSVVKVNKDWTSSNMFDKPETPQDVFVVVTVSLANQGTDNLSISGMWGFKLQDANGALHDEDIAAGVGLNKLDSAASELAPGGSVTGDLIFEVPAKATSQMVLNYQPLFSFGQPVNINLQ